MDYIKFLGTGGARIVVSKQLRSSGGIWLSLKGTNIYLDPGPGALVRCTSSRPSLDPTKLDAIILSHKHLDHSSDVNVMIEAMTEGGFKKRGVLFAPEDALSDDPVVLKYVRKYLKEIQILEEGKSYHVGNISFSTPLRHIHGDVQTYGLNFEASPYRLSFITDTRFFPKLLECYRGEVLIINVVRLKKSNLDHLCIDDVKRIIKEVHPKVAILTHFGMTILRAKPWKIAEEMQNELGTKVIAATDGMKFNLEEMTNGEGHRLHC